ncbi:MAG: DUF349 domain-containing protein [Luteibaculum sp.]
MQELLARLSELLKQEFNKEIITEGKQVVEDLEMLFHAKHQEALNEFLQDPENKREDFSPVKTEEEVQFENLKADFKEKRKAFAERRAAQEKENLQKKEEIINKVSILAREEENIGKAFSAFKELQEQWKEIGRVPGDKHKDIQNAYMSAVDSFYYHINIYRDLKVFDLKKNLEHKQEIVAKLEVLAKADTPNMEENVKQLQQEWYDVGPVPKEDFEALKEKFTAALDNAYELIKAKRQERKELMLQNIEKKREILKQAEEIVAQKPDSAKAWNEATDKIIELQKAWKEIGFGPRKDNEQVWKEFRAVCDEFFNAKGEFYQDYKKELTLNQNQKEELCDKAEVFAQSTDWKEATKKIIDLQKRWKKIGPAPQAQEQKLWKRFRAACDGFFQAKENSHKKLSEAFEQNLQEKQTLVKELEQYKAPSDKPEAVKELKKFYNRWVGIGKVPRENISEINDAFQKAFDAKLEEAGVDKNELEHSKFTSRISALLSEDNFEAALKKERRFIQEKMEEFKKQAIQYENNMAFFGNAKNSKNPLLEEAKKKIAATHNAIEKMQEQVDYINKSMRARIKELAEADANKEAETQSAEGNA